MTKFLFGTAALALLAAAPASAQLLGGGGGGMIGGTLGGMGGGAGSIGGTLGGIGDLPRAGSDTVGRASGSARADKSVDRRSGRVKASGSGSGDGSIASTGTIADRTIGTTGALSGSGSGSADAQLVGTDAVHSAGQQAVGTARGVAQNARNTAGSTANQARNYAGSASGSVSGAGNGAAALGGSSLALAGTAAANGAGSFDVMRGMDVTDAKGRVIGTVQDVRTTAEGKVRDVLVQVGDRTATLPAANFSGSGNALVSAMGKSDVKDAAKDQAAN